MSQWLERHVSLQHVQLGAAAIFGSIATAGVIFGSIALRRRVATEDLKASIPSLSDKHHAQNVRLSSEASPSRHDFSYFLR